MPRAIPETLIRSSRNPSQPALKQFDARRYYAESRRIGYDFCLVEQPGGEMAISESFPEDIDAVAERRAELQLYLESFPGARRLLACCLGQVGRVTRLSK